MNENQEKTVEQVAEEIVEVVKEVVPEESREELQQAVEQLTEEEIAEKKRLEELEQFLMTKKNKEKWLARRRNLEIKLEKRDGSAVGITRKNKSQSKKSRSISKKSRKINRRK